MNNKFEFGKGQYEFIESIDGSRVVLIDKSGRGYVKPISDDVTKGIRAMLADREILQKENERLREALQSACDALHNDFEPDNQSRDWHAARTALRDYDGKKEQTI